MQAVFNGNVVADADKKDLIYIEGNWYFPLSSVNQEYLQKSDTQYHCFWKGDAQYYDVVVGDQTAKDGAFGYPKPLPGALEKVKKDFSKHVAFWQGVDVKETDE